MTPALEPLDLKELRDLAERAALTWTKLRIIDDLWAAEYAYIAAASPQVLLRLIQEREEMVRALKAILADAYKADDYSLLCDDFVVVGSVLERAATLLAKLGEEGL